MSVASSDSGNEVLIPEASVKHRRDRRLYRRFNCEAPATVRLVSSGITLTGNIRDLSMTGCSIEFPKRFPVGVNVRLEVLFTLQGLPLTLPAVSRCIHSPKYIGIEFLHVSLRKRAAIAEVIAELEEKMEVEKEKGPEPKTEN